MLSISHVNEAFRCSGWTLFVRALAMLLWIVTQPAWADPRAALPGDVAALFAREVSMRLKIPSDEQSAYARRLNGALAHAGLVDLAPQYFVLVDRSPRVQAALVYWRASNGDGQFVGAAPVSTGRAGAFEYFTTPLGVFEHTPVHGDFRAEGTRNKLGVRGYGVKGMRVFDFGWVLGERGWGPPGKSPMRLQMHATDPDLLEHQLGMIHSKGCVRIPAALNVFIGRYGLLDAEYELKANTGARLWVLRADRTPVPSAGRYLVVVDSERQSRPGWSPPPGAKH
jgi:hypothetical protein